MKKILLALCLLIPTTALADRSVTSFPVITPASDDYWILTDTSNSGLLSKVATSGVRAALGLATTDSPSFVDITSTSDINVKDWIYFMSDDNSHTVAVAAGNNLANYILRWPVALGSGGLLTSDNAGQMSFTDPASFLTPSGVGGALTVTATGFNGNLTTDDNTVQEIAQKFDDFTAAGTGDMILASAQTVTGKKTFENSDIAILGSSTGSTTLASANAGASNYTITFPATTGSVPILTTAPTVDQQIMEWDTTTSSWIPATPTDITAGAGIDIVTGSISVEEAIRTKEVAWTIKDSDVVTAVADGKQAFAVPASMNGMNLVDCTATVADLNSAASGSTTVVLRRVRGATAVDMTSTGVTVAYNEYSASDETVDTANDDLATGDKLYPDVNAVTSAVHKGLSLTCLFRLP